MKIITFNVNGIRAMFTKTKDGQRGATSDNHCLQMMIHEQSPDVICLQEIKLTTPSDVAGLHSFAAATGYPYSYVSIPSEKKGYSGVALLSRTEPEWVAYGLRENGNGIWAEGRMIRAKIGGIHLIGVYVPNAQPDLVRIAERVEWEKSLETYVAEQVAAGEQVMLCGDMNVAPEDCDIHRKQPRGTPGASAEERSAFHALLAAGVVDSFRALYPEDIGYTYWSNFHQSREKNKGWRIDLFLVSANCMPCVNRVTVLSDYHGSDHCPVLCEIDENRPVVMVRRLRKKQAISTSHATASQSVLHDTKSTTSSS